MLLLKETLINLQYWKFTYQKTRIVNNGKNLHGCACYKGLGVLLAIETNCSGMEAFYVALAHFRIGKLYRCLALPRTDEL